MCSKLWTHAFFEISLSAIPSAKCFFVTVLKAQTPLYQPGLQKQTTEQVASVDGTEQMCRMTVRVLFYWSAACFCWPCYLSVRNQSAFGGFHLVNMHECFCKIRMSACSVFATIVQHGWHRRCYLCSKNLMILAKGCSLHERVFCHSSKVPPSFCCPWIRIPEAEERETVRAQWYETDVYFLPVVQHVYVLMEKWIPVKMFCNAFFWMEQHVATHSLLHYDSIFEHSLLWCVFILLTSI